MPNSLSRMCMLCALLAAAPALGEVTPYTLSLDDENSHISYWVKVWDGYAVGTRNLLLEAEGVVAGLGSIDVDLWHDGDDITQMQIKSGEVYPATDPHLEGKLDELRVEFDLHNVMIIYDPSLQGYTSSVVDVSRSGYFDCRDYKAGFGDEVVASISLGEAMTFTIDCFDCYAFVDLVGALAMDAGYPAMRLRTGYQDSVGLGMGYDLEYGIQLTIETSPLTPVTVPEPTTLIAFAVGGLVVCRRRR